MDENAVVWLDYDFGSVAGANAISLLLGLVGTASPPSTTVRLAGGNDGELPLSSDFYGQPADLDDATIKATGLNALGEIDDIAIEAVPDAGALDSPDERMATADLLIQHCESLQYRFAIVDGPQGSSINDIREFRGNFDSDLRGPVPPVDRDHRPGPADRAGGAAAEAAPPAVRLHGRHLRARRRRPRRLQGAGQRGGPRPRPVRVEHRQGPGRGAEPRGDQRAAFLPRSREPRVGRPDAELGPALEVHQRAAPVHLPRALDRQGHPVGGLRAEQRDAVAAGRPGGEGLPPRSSGCPAPCSGRPRTRRTSSAATDRP